MSARPIRWLAIAVAALAVTGCGADDQGAGALLERSLDKPAPSGDVTLDLRAEARGGDADLEDGVRLRASGPFIAARPGELPRFDWDVTLDARNGGVSANVISTGTNAYVEVLGTAYEVGEGRVREALEERAAKPDEDDLRGLGIDPQAWVRTVRDEGTEDVGGVSTRHVSAELDVARFVADVGKLHGPDGEGLSEQEQADIVASVREPRLEFWIGEQDEIIRRFEGEASFEVPEARRRPGHPESGSISLSVEVRNVGTERPIVAPANPRPIEELLGEGGLPPGLLGLSATGAGSAS